MRISVYHSEPVADRLYNPVFESPLSDRGLRRQLQDFGLFRAPTDGIFVNSQPPTSACRYQSTTDLAF
jgi:hypothetical protein